MSSKTVITCDIKGCEDGASYSEKTRVVFYTEQNEGRSSLPYFDTVDLDLCKQHYIKFLESYPITAIGAMGYNDYTLNTMVSVRDTNE